MDVSPQIGSNAVSSAGWRRRLAIPVGSCGEQRDADAGTSAGAEGGSLCGKSGELLGCVGKT